MALTGLQIFKYLPGGKKEKEANCKKCGFSTCMAFAMKLAKKEAPLNKCEHISDELKALLEESYQVQQQEIIFGPKENQVKIGGETVMFRHDKKFVNPTCIAIKLESADPDFDSKFNKIINYSIERVGETLKVNAIALKDTDNSFVEKAKKIALANIPQILMSPNVEALKDILESIKETKPVVYLENNNLEVIAQIDKTFDVPVIVTANSIEELVKNSTNLLQAKAEKLVLNLANNAASKSNIMQNMTYIRRAAIEDKFAPLGFPVINFVENISGLENNVFAKSIWLTNLLCKYASILVLNEFDEALVYSLLTLRQNIFTDPQKPLQIEPNIYPIGDVNEYSPVMVTTNFALTYFSVANEIEASGIPAYLLITPSDGMSVLTAWAASKFTGEIIAKAAKQYALETLVKHRQLIIPGYVSSLKEEIKEEMSGWEVVIGTNEAVDIPEHLREYQKSLVKLV